MFTLILELVSESGEYLQVDRLSRKIVANIMELELKFSRSEFDFIININEPGIEAIFIRKIVSKFEDCRFLCVYDIRHTDRKSCKYMQCPNVYQCVSQLMETEKIKIIFPYFSKLVAMKTF